MTFFQFTRRVEDVKVSWNGQQQIGNGDKDVSMGRDDNLDPVQLSTSRKRTV